MSLRMKIESEVARAMTKFYRDLLGKGPEETKVYIIDDLVLVRLRGTLTREEQQLARTQRGCQLIKEIREELRELNLGEEERIISKITGYEVLNSQGNISTITGEAILVFIMEQNIGKIFSGKSCGKDMTISRHPV